MKNKHICPKCNSNNIVKVSDNEGVNRTNRYNIRISSLHWVRVVRYVCCDCGFAEEWVEDKADLKEIETKYC